MPSRREICEACPHFRRGAVRAETWCARIDQAACGCDGKRHKRWYARTKMHEVSCRQWLPAENCPVCRLADPLADLPADRPGNWQHDPHYVARHVAAYAEIRDRDLTPPSNLAGDGIVTFHAHPDGHAWPGLVVGAKLLRATGCQLPLQIWTRGHVGHELEDDPLTTLIDADYMLQRHTCRHAARWAMKSYALAHSGFARALLLDWDAYCVADPAPLFDLLSPRPPGEGQGEGYSFVYWSNVPRWDNADHHFLAPVARQPWSPVIQGGHYLIDCRRAWRELMLLRYFDDRADFFWERCRSKDEAGLRVMLAACGTRYLHVGPADWEEVAFNCRQDGTSYIVHRCEGKIWPDHRPRSNPRLPREAQMLEILLKHFPSAAGENQHEYRARLRAERRRVLGLAGAR